MRLLDGKRWTHSSATNVAATFRSHGFRGPQELAEEAERQESYDGALRCMKRLQAEAASARKVVALPAPRRVQS